MLFNQKTKKTNILPVFAVATFGLNMMTLMLLMFHNSMLQRLTSKLPQSLVQLNDGRAITVNSQKYSERNPDTIRRFVGEMMTLMFTWSDKQPPEPVWQGVSQLVSGDVRQKMEGEILQKIPRNILQNGIRDVESVLLIRRISTPKKIREGQWELDIIANRLLLTPNNRSGEAIPFNKKIFVQSVEEHIINPPKGKNVFHSAVYRLNESRLEINNICDIKDESCAKKMMEIRQ